MEENVFCDCEVIHGAVVEAVRDRMPDESELYDLADFFKIFGDSTRPRSCGRWRRARCACATWRCY